VKKQFPLA